MQTPRNSAFKVLQLAVLMYLTAALLYTTSYFIVSPVSTAIQALFRVHDVKPGDVFSYAHSVSRVDLVDRAIQAAEEAYQHPAGTHSQDISLMSLLSSDDLLYWVQSKNGDNADLASTSSVPLREETFLSKAFSLAMHPTKIIPFYYKASGPISEDDVTITTLVTSNRFKVLKQLVERYQGPISVTIHIPLPPHAQSSPDSTHQFISAVKKLQSLYESSPHFATYVDVHLALSPFASTPQSDSGTSEGGRQFNVWRNVARLFARTEFVMMLDVDFAICTDWRTLVRDAIRYADDYKANTEQTDLVPRSLERKKTLDLEVVKKLRDGTAALVLPAFEYIKQEDGISQSTFPRDKQSLVRLTSSSSPKITTFHSSWAPGHNSTDYPKYFSIPPGASEVYKVTTYQSAYEPYVITSRRVSWCDERFTGYGGNKAACLFEMYLSGVSFYVLSDHFLIHQSHKYEEEARREERKYNRKLYADFKEETCMRYIYRFHTEGRLRTPLAANALEECRKMKSVVKFAMELLGEDITVQNP